MAHRFPKPSTAALGVPVGQAGAGFVRCSYATSMANIEKAMEILGREVEDGSWDGVVVEALGSIDRISS